MRKAERQFVGDGEFVADQISYGRLTLAIAGGLVLGSIISWILWMVVTAGVVSAILSGFYFTFDEPPHSAVTSSARYQDAMDRQDKDEALKRRAQHERLEYDRQQRLQAEHTRQVQAVQRQRSSSPTGKRLWQACDEWSANYKSTPTPTTRVNAKFHCDRYNRYIESGYVSSGDTPLLETR